MPESLRPGLSSAMLKSVFDDIEEAMKTGTLDEIEDRHLSRTPMVVDKQGWGETASLLSETLDRLLGIQAAASERIAANGEPGILAKVEMLHFKSPNPAPETTAETESEAAATE
jgi:hypothetical protein